MQGVAMIAIKRGGRLIPLCRTASPEVLKVVAEAALADIERAADAERGTDEAFATLLQQEAERVGKALRLLGLMAGA